MKGTTRLIGVFAALVIGAIHPISSQEEFPSEKDLRGSPERYEGFRQYEYVAARQLELKSAIMLFKEYPLERPEYFTLGFFVDSTIQTANVDILVEDRRGKGYYMMPVRTKWGAGHHQFRWNNELAEKEGLGLSDLYARAKVIPQMRRKTIVPIKLYYDVSPRQVERYEFIFMATRRVNLRYRITNEQREVLATGSLENQLKNADIVIIWGCKAVPPGRYTLQVRYAFLVGRPEKAVDSYQFYHAGLTTVPVPNDN